MKKPSLLSTLNLTNKQAPAVKTGSLLAPAPSSAPVSPAVSKTPMSTALALAQVASARQAEQNDKAKMLFTGLPIDGQQLLDNFDSLMSQSASVSLANIDTARAYVKKIMIDLKNNPEFDRLFLDRDAHNVIKLIRGLQESGQATIEVKKAKAVKASTAKATRDGRFGDLSGLSLGFGENIEDMPLEDLSKLEF